jgi:deoxyribodipyrimidine photo-lyase
MTTIFLFHRDLRLEDNVPLQEALKYCNENKTEFLPVFIFTPEQVGKKAPICSLKSVASMIQSLQELNESIEKELKTSLCLIYDDNIKALEKIFKELEIKALFETKDYTPYAKKREASFQKWCDSKSIHFEPIDYLYLNAPGEIKNKSNTVYQKFTPFYEASLKLNESRRIKTHKFDSMNVKSVSKTVLNKISNITLNEMIKTLGLNTEEIENRIYKGGREEALGLLGTLPKNYDKIRDIMVEETSGLSVHHHYGTIGIRETYQEAKKSLSGKAEEEFIRQLYWRDFYGQIVCFFEELYDKDAIEYDSNPKLTKEQEKIYQDWCNGETGVDIIDAAMTQLNQIGYMQNRARTLVANYLAKTLKIHWRFGERYFAQKLLDYDFSQNFGNWCYVTSPYNLPFTEPSFRVYNPESYKKRFDSKGEYIDEWIHE